MSGAESSDSCSDNEMAENDSEPPMSIFVTPDHEVFNSISPPLSPLPQKSIPNLSISTSTQNSPPSLTSVSSSKSQITSSSSQPPPMLSPLVYQTAQGMMYATPSNGGVILSLSQGNSSNSQPQFITIPLSMVAANGHQGELDLSKRK